MRRTSCHVVTSFRCGEENSPEDDYNLPEDDDTGEISYSVPVCQRELNSNGTWVVNMKEKSGSSVSSLQLSNENLDLKDVCYFLICFCMASRLYFLFAFYMAQGTKL